MKYSNGSAYVGIWKDEKHGKGVMTYADRTVYDGEWYQGSKQGEGRLTHPDGSVTAGTWNGDRFVP